MTTRTKQSIASCTSSIMLLLVVFSKPLHIPESAQWVLLLGVFIALWLLFKFNKKLKQERSAPTVTDESRSQTTTTRTKSAKNRLLLIMAIGVLIGLGAPFWMPLTGTTLGHVGDLICGLITAAVVCVIFGIRLRKV